MAKTSLIIQASPQSVTLLPQSLPLLAAQDDIQFEVLIADAVSDPETADMVQQWQAKVPFVLHYVTPPDWALNDAAAANRAASETYGDYLVFLTDGLLVKPDFVRQHRRLAERGWFVSTEPQRWWHRSLPPYHQGRKKQAVKSTGFDDVHLGVWRQDFKTVGGFDERFIGLKYRMDDLAVRLQRIGVRHKAGRGLCAYTRAANVFLRDVNENYTLLQETLHSERVLAMHAPQKVLSRARQFA